MSPVLLRWSTRHAGFWSTTGNLEVLSIIVSMAEILGKVLLVNKEGEENSKERIVPML